MPIDNRNIAEIRKHIIDNHSDLIGQSDFLAVSNNPNEMSIDVVCCDHKWKFSTIGVKANGSTISASALYQIVRTAVYSDLHLLKPDKEELHVNPISDIDL